jgi:hypothetical protein
VLLLGAGTSVCNAFDWRRTQPALSNSNRSAAPIAMHTEKAVDTAAVIPPSWRWDCFTLLTFAGRWVRRQVVMAHRVARMFPRTMRSFVQVRTAHGDAGHACNTSCAPAVRTPCVGPQREAVHGLVAVRWAGPPMI